MRRGVCATVAVAAGILACAVAESSMPKQVRPQRQDYNSGWYLYRVYCASCHGEEGRGDGLVADLLRKPPPDLRTIAKRSGGTFQRDRIAGIIDGRAPIPGHTQDDMRAWANVLKITEGSDERTIRVRIEALVTHLESIQER